MPLGRSQAAGRDDTASDRRPSGVCFRRMPFILALGGLSVLMALGFALRLAVLLWVPVPVPASVVESLPSLLQAVARVAASVQQAKMDRSRR